MTIRLPRHRFAFITIGQALRSKPRCNPLIVSPGHCVTVTADSALEWTLRHLRGYRLPEPTRLADRAGLAPRRGERAGDRRSPAVMQPS
ncbi:hypothetical protein A6R73_12560 [Xanthomonas translucens pv. poae]|uniref:Endonuclease V n=1 Tax=Xanthomonas graminis pv. poae TaxID=227946 RepID=A0A199P6C9_9XANT|nr:hypothetical protein A6R73_12560 [Xanthomonas translucens pv. poae]